MRAEDWQRASVLFERALDLAPGARMAWLDAECRDPALRAEVVRLLAADAAADDFLERPLLGIASPDDFAVADARAGARFGAWRTLRPIGAGGMGEVWLAERADGAFEQQVAIKRLAYPTPELVRRFRHERRVLAGLHHPHIARLFDAGLGEDGAPYFVMEYVAGEPLATYCEAHGLGLAARIGLFLQVCDAVQYAHRSLVVHRDLKPSNILVTADGDAKLLDFGIAKVIDTGADGDATATLVQRMTPDYAAPEQIRGEAVTTATDVYALGVLLHELLAGERPFRRHGRHGDPARVRVEAPPQASTAAARSAGAPRAWAHRLRGDLDRIVAKAMAAEPDRRYAGAEALADDLRRHLDGRPVSARGDDPGYRVRRFVARHRVAVMAAAAVAFALVAATAISVQQARRAEAQARRAEAEKAFVLGILDANDPNDTQGRGETLTARQILDRAAERIDADLADQPAVRAELHDEIGNLYWDYGQYARALPMYERSARLAAENGLPAAQRVGILIDLADDQRMLRKLDAAIASLREAGALARADAGAESALALRVRGENATTLAYASRFDEAEAEARAWLQIVERARPPDEAAQADALNTLAFTLTERRPAEAAELLARVLVLNQRLHPQPHSAVSTTNNDLGFALFGAGRLAEADTALRRALAIHEKLLGRAHPHYAGSEANLARVVDMEGHFDAAHALLDDALATRRRVLGDDADALDGTWRAIAVNAMHRGDSAAAEAAARRAVELDTRVYPDRHFEVVQSRLVLGEVLDAAGRGADAADPLRRAAADGDAAIGRPNRFSARARALLAHGLARDQRYADAATLFAQALDELRAAVGERHFDYADALAWRGEAELASGDRARAIATLHAATDAAQAAYPPGDPLRDAGADLLARAGAR